MVTPLEQALSQLDGYEDYMEALGADRGIGDGSDRDIGDYEDTDAADVEAVISSSSYRYVLAIEGRKEGGGGGGEL